MAYGPYDSFTNNALSTFLGINRMRGRNAPDDKEQLEAYKKSIEETRKGADEGIKPQFATEQVSLPSGKVASRFTEDAVKKYTSLGGESGVQQLDERAIQAAKDKHIDRTIKVDENASKIVEQAFKDKDRYESATGQKYPTDIFNLKMSSAKSLYKVLGRELDPSQFESLADFKQAKKVEDEKVITNTYNSFIKKPNADDASKLAKYTLKYKIAHGGTDNQFKVIDDAVNKFNTEQVKPPRDKFRTFAGPGGSRLQVNETTGEEKTILGRKDESGAGATAKQGRLNNSYKIYDEKWVEIAKANLGSNAEAIKGLFNTDELGGGVNSGRLRNALTPEQRKNYDWGKKRVEVHAVGNESAEAVDKALTEIQKAYKGSSNPAPSSSSGSKKITAERGGQPQAASAPPVKYLKEGQQTTFKNGEVWTLQNGKPVRIK